VEERERQTVQAGFELSGGLGAYDLFDEVAGNFPRAILFVHRSDGFYRSGFILKLSIELDHYVLASWGTW
jgi:hypothetical protein